ncbi:MAG: RDD family protein [Thermoanaerobaculia bacterium]
MARETAQITLLRVAAFLIDALSVALALVLPASIISYTAAWFASPRTINLTWYLAGAIFVTAILLRDAIGGKSPGKRMLGLLLTTRSGRPCGVGRSVLRNLPLLIPGWNLIEAYLVAFTRSGRRTGDRIAGTTVSEE